MHDEVEWHILTRWYTITPEKDISKLRYDDGVFICYCRWLPRTIKRFDQCVLKQSYSFDRVFSKRPRDCCRGLFTRSKRKHTHMSRLESRKTVVIHARLDSSNMGQPWSHGYGIVGGTNELWIQAKRAYFYLSYSSTQLHLKFCISIVDREDKCVRDFAMMYLVLEYVRSTQAKPKLCPLVTDSRDTRISAVISETMIWIRQEE